MDLAVEAHNELGYSLVVVGLGQQTPAALALAARHFESIEWQFQPETNRNNALQFDTQRVSDRFQHFIEERFQKHRC